MENVGKFKNGKQAWNKGIRFSEEIRKRMSEACLGRKHSEETKKKMSLTRRKNGGRLSWGYRNWRDKVKERDNWICQECGCQNKQKLHAHHIVRWEEDESKRFDITNGITLCNSCHAKKEGFEKGHIGWTRGKKLTEDHRKKLSIAKKGHPPAHEKGFKKGNIPTNKGKKGQIAWNKGKKTGPLSEEHKKKLRDAKIDFVPWNAKNKQGLK